MPNTTSSGSDPPESCLLNGSRKPPCSPFKITISLQDIGRGPEEAVHYRGGETQTDPQEGLSGLQVPAKKEERRQRSYERESDPERKHYIQVSLPGRGGQGEAMELIVLRPAELSNRRTTYPAMGDLRTAIRGRRLPRRRLASSKTSAALATPRRTCRSLRRRGPSLPQRLIQISTLMTSAVRMT